MAKTKTAISIPRSLFNEVTRLARKMHISRSELFAKAAADFIKRQKNRDILHRLNEVYAAPDGKEKGWQVRAKNRHRDLVGEEW
jgi:metal-responsive CopG/Arc/MetJ family transcriptional regulator